MHGRGKSKPALCACSTINTPAARIKQNTPRHIPPHINYVLILHTQLSKITLTFTLCLRRACFHLVYQKWGAECSKRVLMPKDNKVSEEEVMFA